MNNKTYRWWRPEFSKYYWITMRPYLLFVSGFTGLAGLAYADHISSLLLFLLALSFFLSYGFGQALTDCFQMDTDAISAPYRPLVQGIITKGDVLWFSLAGLTFCGIVVSYACWWNLLLAFLAVLGLASYTFFKKRWWAGPWYNAWIVADLFLIAYFAGQGRIQWHGVPWDKAFWVLLGYADFVLVGYFKDVQADRATGYHTLPVVFGYNFSRWVAHIIVSAVIVWSAVYYLFPLNGPALVLIVMAAVALAWGHGRLHNVKNDRQAFKAVEPVVHGYLFLMASIIIEQKFSWWPVLAVLYVLFLGTLKKRPMREQI